MTNTLHTFFLKDKLNHFHYFVLKNTQTITDVLNSKGGIKSLNFRIPQTYQDLDEELGKFQPKSGEYIFTFTVSELQDYNTVSGLTFTNLEKALKWFECNVHPMYMDEQIRLKIINLMTEHPDGVLYFKKVCETTNKLGTNLTL